MTRRSFKSRLAGGFCLRAPAQGTCTQYRPGFPCCSGSIEAARAHCQDFFGSAVPVLALPDYLAPGPIRSRSKTSASLSRGACSRSWWVM